MNALALHVTKWINLKNIMLNRMQKLQKNAFSTISCFKILKIYKTILYIIWGYAAIYLMYEMIKTEIRIMLSSWEREELHR